MAEPETVVVADGKYTWFQDEQTRDIHVLRYNEPWLVLGVCDTRGFNAIAALLRRAIELEQQTKGR